MIYEPKALCLIIFDIASITTIVRILNLVCSLHLHNFSNLLRFWAQIDQFEAGHQPNRKMKNYISSIQCSSTMILQNMDQIFLEL